MPERPVGGRDGRGRERCAREPSRASSGSSLLVAASSSSIAAQTETNSSGVSSLASCAAAIASSIAAETVEEHRARPARVLDRGSLAAGRGLLDRGVDQPGRVGLAALKAGEHEGAVRRDLGARGLGDAVGLGDQQRRPAELSAQRHGLRHHVDADREHGQRAGLARELDPARGDREAGLVVPHHHGGRGREPPPAKDLLDRDVARPQSRSRPARAPAPPRSGPR